MTDPSVRDLVDRALLPLRAVDGALHDRAVDYVVDGAGVQGPVHRPEGEQRPVDQVAD